MLQHKYSLLSKCNFIKSFCFCLTVSASLMGSSDQLSDSNNSEQPILSSSSSTTLLSSHPSPSELQSTCQTRDQIQRLACLDQQTPNHMLLILRNKVRKKPSRLNLMSLVNNSGGTSDQIRRFSSDSLSGSNSEESLSPTTPTSPKKSSPESKAELLWQLSKNPQINQKIRTNTSMLEIMPDKFADIFCKYNIRDSVNVFNCLQFIHYCMKDKIPFFPNKIDEWFSTHKDALNKFTNPLCQLYFELLPLRNIIHQSTFPHHPTISEFLVFLKNQKICLPDATSYLSFWNDMSLLIGDSCSPFDFIPCVRTFFKDLFPFCLQINHPNFARIPFDHQTDQPVLTDEAVYEPSPWDPSVFSDELQIDFSEHDIELTDEDRILDWLTIVARCIDPTYQIQKDSSMHWFLQHKDQVESRPHDWFILYDEISELRAFMAATFQYVSYASTPEFLKLTHILQEEYELDLSSVDRLAAFLEDISFILGPSFVPSWLLSQFTAKSQGHHIEKLMNAYIDLQRLTAGEPLTSSDEEDNLPNTPANSIELD